MPGTTPLRTIATVRATTTIVAKRLSIGGTQFGDFEHPPELEFGLEQKIASNDRIGGTRAVQALGSFGRDVEWSGYLRGPSANTRVRDLSRMEKSGAEVRLKWLLERYDVVITEFRWKYLQQWFMDYAITVHIVRDASVASKKQQPNVDAQTSALSNQASSYASSIAGADSSSAAQSLQSATTGLTGSLADVSPVAQSSGANAASFIAQVNGVLKQATTYLAQVTGVFPNSHILNVQQLIATLQLLATNVQRGQAPAVARSFTGSLATLCARQYGDPGLAQTLAAANNLTSTRVPAGTYLDIVLPPLIGKPPL